MSAAVLFRPFTKLLSSPKHRVGIVLHIPKTAGTSFLEMSRARFGDRLFQNTSQVANFEAGLDGDVFSLTDPSKIRLVFGHHVYESTVQYFAGETRELFMMTFLREPLERLRSQFRFDCQLARDLGTEPPVEQEFVQRNEDAMCRFLTERFPRLAGPDGPLWSRALRVLSGFDHVLLHTEVGAGFRSVDHRLNDLTLRRVRRVPHANTVAKEVAGLRLSDQALALHNAHDLTLYRTFLEARGLLPGAQNPLAQPFLRARLQSLVREPFDAELHMANVAGSLVLELVMAKGLDCVFERYRMAHGSRREVLRRGLTQLGYSPA